MGRGERSEKREVTDEGCRGTRGARRRARGKLGQGLGETSRRKETEKGLPALENEQRQSYRGGDKVKEEERRKMKKRERSRARAKIPKKGVNKG